MSFVEFLRVKGGATEKQIPYYERWVRMYLDWSERRWKEESSCASFLLSLAGAYEDWQVQQARHALRLHSYYLAVRGGAKSSQAPPLRQLGTINWNTVEQTVSQLMRLKHLSYRTEKTYLSWIMRFRSFVGAKECAALGENDLKSFLSYLAVEKRVSRATQRLAFNALLFLFRNILAVEIHGLGTVVPSSGPRRLPVVLAKEEVRAVFSHLEGTHLLMATILYGAGLRLQECLSLRVKDVDFARSCLTIRAGKGGKDRETVLPEKVCLNLKRQLERVRALYTGSREISRRSRAP